MKRPHLLTADKNFAVTVRSNYFCQKLNCRKSFKNKRITCLKQQLRQLQQQQKRQPLDYYPIKLSGIYRFILLFFTSCCARIYLLFQKIKNFLRFFKTLRFHVIFACCGQNAVKIQRGFFGRHAIRIMRFCVSTKSTTFPTIICALFFLYAIDVY